LAGDKEELPDDIIDNTADYTKDSGKKCHTCWVGYDVL
jgi:hypothetical protein